MQQIFTSGSFILGRNLANEKFADSCLQFNRSSHWVCSYQKRNLANEKFNNATNLQLYLHLWFVHTREKPCKWEASTLLLVRACAIVCLLVHAHIHMQVCIKTGSVPHNINTSVWLVFCRKKWNQTNKLTKLYLGETDLYLILCRHAVCVYPSVCVCLFEYVCMCVCTRLCIC